MPAFERFMFKVLAVIAVFVVLSNIFQLSGPNVRTKISKIAIPGLPKYEPKEQLPIENNPPKVPPNLGDVAFDDSEESVDAHPISILMREADERWAKYNEDRSTTFKATVAKYRRVYGRHPPPGFKEWYQFARDRNVHNIDDFQQIMDDLRPFWAVEPKTIRLLAAHMWSGEDDAVTGVQIRNHKVTKNFNGSWRSETFITLVKRFIKYLPDMDIAMNRLDQPRVVVPWDNMQALLAKEMETRQTPPDAIDSFSTGMDGFYNETAVNDTDREDPQWYPAHGKQYMDIAKTACPPESHARDENSTTVTSEELYKSKVGGIIINFNRSTDLCTVGPEVQDKHGFLYSASTVLATKRLVPIFAECKVNVNSDILFPANMYWKHDDRYDYNNKYDWDWEDKYDKMVWRGVTSGGAQTPDNWRTMHRQRLVMDLNHTEIGDSQVRISSEDPQEKGRYINFDTYQPATFANRHTDVGFVEAWGCVPDCHFYDDVWTFKPQLSMSEQFKHKYLVDVDGHSFSGRWRAFLESKSLGIKATIFREWHDSRLFAWRHFVPMDNRYDDVYSLLTYFIGLRSKGKTPKESAYVSRHDFEGKRIARQGREWAGKVLRRDDIEIYTFRLLLEYARIIDDNRDRIGYSGDGSELDKYDLKHPPKHS
ncbi:MAG: hypothetical protein M1836_003934 [Candelina mexicana]|nr:MAG: hypothetical protein M1836_003934 [Candelina mexicana]